MNAYTSQRMQYEKQKQNRNKVKIDKNVRHNIEKAL